MEKLEARFYRSLVRIRRVEEEVVRVYPTDKIKSPVHLSIGQEAVSVGVCEALRREDVVFGTYRGHAFYLAKGGDLRRMVAELYGKAPGCTKGKGGSMHLVDTSVGVMGASAVVATTIPQAVGYALAMKFRKENRVVVSFFGDGAIEEGAFHESANFAALRQVPVIFICENNLYAVHTPIRDRQPPVPIYKRLEGYGIPAERIENNDVEKIYERVKAAADEMRRTHSGPRFFECMTYRWKEHVGPNEDFHAGYRGRSEAEPWFENDPVRRMGEKLEPSVRKQIEQKVYSEIREAFDFAEQSPFPADEELYTDLLAAPSTAIHGAPGTGPEGSVQSSRPRRRGAGA